MVMITSTSKAFLFFSFFLFLGKLGYGGEDLRLPLGGWYQGSGQDGQGRQHPPS